MLTSFMAANLNGHLSCQLQANSTGLISPPGTAWLTAVLTDLRIASCCACMQALRAFKQLATARPGDPEVVKALARLYHQLGQVEDAREVLHQQVHSYPDAVDLTHVNILAELYMEATDWKLAVDVIQHAKHALCGQADLPVELQASCRHRHAMSAALLD